MNYQEILGYDPKQLHRELTPYYISASDQDISEMLHALSIQNCSELFSHIPKEVKFQNSLDLPEKLSYDQLIHHLQGLANKNKSPLSFIGDGVKNYKIPPIVSHICQIRGLTTAYTPYQPERSQGTLWSLWIYASALKAITGFEAINASLYDRSTCLFEALGTAKRIHKKGNAALVLDSIYPGDKEVLETLKLETDLTLIYIKTNQQTGTYDKEDFQEKLEKYQSSLMAIAFPQINHLGNLEDVHVLTDTCYQYGLQSIAIIDPLTLGENGLIPPIQFGSKKQGCHMIVGEGQHLALEPNFGGPGLGIFGIRFNDNNKTSIRSTAGRYVGKTKDRDGKEALCMVLSTREQHIRREKASSNICSNQSFVATLAGASLISKGSEGLKKVCQKVRQNALKAFSELSSLEGITPTFPKTPFFNEFCLTIHTKKEELKKKAKEKNIQIGYFVEERIQSKEAILLLSFFDGHTDEDLNQLIQLFQELYQTNQEKISSPPPLPQNLQRQDSPLLIKVSEEELIKFYDQLGDQNVSPDDNIYPLGSCTMKYNPHINDWAASLPKFTKIHPQSDPSDAQGSLELLFHIQEMFTTITGLKGVTTQPVAGAQGELVGLKMFQAYHEDKGEGLQRNIILIPKTAHGTNPATAHMAGYITKKTREGSKGIITLGATPEGLIDILELKNVIKQYGPQISGIMVTNPNTSGIFEVHFKKMAELIHACGGLVYMDGANMNAIAGIIDLKKLGVDAIHNNLHKTWTIPHGGGGPGDAIVAVSEKLYDYLPGIQVKNENGLYVTFKTKKSIGSFHRHYGNFAHKIRCYTYLRALGARGVQRMSEIAVLSARYLYQELKDELPSLPSEAHHQPRMHEFILTLSKEHFDLIEKSGTIKPQIIAKVGKLFLDFGLHAPTVAFPEMFGLMVEPTESFTKKELDKFVSVVKALKQLITETPEVLTTVPHFTPVGKIDEVAANKNLVLYEDLKKLPLIYQNKISPSRLEKMELSEVLQEIIKSHHSATKKEEC